MSKQENELIGKYPSPVHKVIKRTAAGRKASPRMGYAAIIMNQRKKNNKKTRKCLKWKNNPFTGKWKCLQLKWKQFVLRPEKKIAFNSRGINQGPR